MSMTSNITNSTKTSLSWHFIHFDDPYVFVHECYSLMPQFHWQYIELIRVMARSTPSHYHVYNMPHLHTTWIGVMLTPISCILSPAIMTSIWICCTKESDALYPKKNSQFLKFCLMLSLVASVFLLETSFTKQKVPMIWKSHSLGENPSTRPHLTRS